MTYWRLLSPDQRAAQESARPDTRITLAGSIFKAPTFQVSRSPYQKLTDKIERLGNGQQRGYQAEERFGRIVADFVRLHRAPAWIFGVEIPTAEEEARKADRVVVTTAGRLAVQIKASVWGARKFRERATQWRHVACVVVEPELSDVEIFWTTVDELCQCYEILHGKQLCHITGNIIPTISFTA